MHMGHDNPRRYHSLNGKIIKAVDEEKNIWACTGQETANQICNAQAVGKEMQSLGIIRTFIHIDKKGFAILEYCV